MNSNVHISKWYDVKSFFNFFPTGEKQVSGNWKEEKNNWICPHVYGGIPLDCVEKVYKMVRDGPKFLSIEGVC